MIVDQDPKGYYDKIVDEPNPEKKAFNFLLAVFVVVLFAFGGTVWYLKSEQKDLRNDSKELQKEIIILRNDALKNNTLYKEGYVKGKEDANAYWQPRYDKLEERSNEALERRVNELTIETRRLKDQSKQVIKEMKRQQ